MLKNGKGLIALLLIGIETHNNKVSALDRVLSDGMYIEVCQFVYSFFGIPEEETDGDGNYLFCRDYLGDKWDEVDWSSVDEVIGFLDFLEKEKDEIIKYMEKQKLKIVKIH